MYIVRFVGSDNQTVEEYLYHKEKDAMFHFSLFEEDDSHLYSHIEVLRIFENREVEIAKINLQC